MKHLLLLLSIIFLSESVIAQWTSDTTTNTIVRDTSDATTPLIASIPDGSTYVSWFEFGGSNYDLHMQLLDSNGYKKWGPEGIVVSNQLQNSALFRYDLKADHNGNAIVAFQDERTGSLNAVVYKIDINGNSLWGPNGITLIDSLAADGISPSIGITALNDVVVAWNSNTPTSKWISAQKFSPSGSFLWSSIYRIRDTLNNLNYSRAELFPSGSDDIQLIYVEENGTFPGVTSTLYTQRIHVGGNNFWPNGIQVSTKTIPYFFFPQPVPDDNGGFFLSFNTSNPVNPALNDVYVQNVDYNGNLWSATGVEAANSITNHKLVSSSIYVSNTNEYWILLQVLDGGQGSSGVSVQKFDALGTPLLGADGTVIIPFDPFYYRPNTINYSVNGVILTLTAGTFGQEHIRAIKLDDNGIPVWPTGGVSLCAVNSNKDDIQSGNFMYDNLVIVWQDDRNGSGVFAQNITDSGYLGIVANVSQIANENNIQLFPNPSAHPSLYFSSDNRTERTITLKDVQGKVIESISISSTAATYSLERFLNLSIGIYFVSVDNLSERKFFKWIKE